MDRTAQNVGTSEVRKAHRFDQARLEQWLAREVEDFVGPLTVEQFRGGQSNPTFRLRFEGRDLILRKQPAGELLPSAHAVDRDIGRRDRPGLAAGVDLVRRADAHAWQEQSTIQLALRAGITVRAVPGEKTNIKLTTIEDWNMAGHLAGLQQ